MLFLPTVAICSRHSLKFILSPFNFVCAAGKKAMADGVGAFNKAASDEYKSLNKAEKERLLELAGKTAEDEG